MSVYKEKISGIIGEVMKPGRYIGGEHNSVVKSSFDELFKVCLSYPDTYEIGMSYLGLQILYDIVNKRDDCLCERVFSPWTDMETKLRNANIPLFSLESRNPVKEFDILGFSLGYELTYTNVLNIMDLSGIPVLSKNRSEEDPLVIAGGPCTLNPIPMLDFIDIFFIGEAEYSLNEFLDRVVPMKKRGASKKEIIDQIKNIKGIFVSDDYKNNVRITKRVVENLDEAPFPEKPIVPFIKIVHDRASVEIMRGCPNGCFFCSARSYYFPARFRSMDKVLRLTKEIIKNTGYNELSFLSLSSADVPYITLLLDEVNKIYAGKGINISMPSLRIDDMCAYIPKIAENRKTGLTFAPEAGSANLRSKLNKNISIEKLYEAAMTAFKYGWNRVKLYFMIGLPGETEEDLRSISDISVYISGLGKKFNNRPADVNVSINAFIPKPHTVFQWRGIDNPDDLKAKQMFIRKNTNNRRVKLDFHDVNLSVLESVLSRGDKFCGDIIYKAWRKGSKFEAWREFFNFDLWRDVFAEEKSDLIRYAERDYMFTQSLPWDNIDMGIDKEFLKRKAEQLI